MDKAIVERAIAALARVGAASRPEPCSEPQSSSAPVVEHEGIACFEKESKSIKARATLQTDAPAADGLAPCGSPHCAGCYEAEPGVRIHPPKCGKFWIQ